MRLPSVLVKLALATSALAAIGAFPCRRRQRGTRRSASTTAADVCSIRTTVQRRSTRCATAATGVSRTGSIARPGGRCRWDRRTVGDPPTLLPEIASGLWMGKTFRTGPNGGALMNLITGARIEGFPAYVYRAGPASTASPRGCSLHAVAGVAGLRRGPRGDARGVDGFNWWQGIFNQPPSYSVSRWPEPWVTRRSSTRHDLHSEERLGTVA